MAQILLILTIDLNQSLLYSIPNSEIELIINIGQLPDEIDYFNKSQYSTAQQDTIGLLVDGIEKFKLTNLVQNHTFTRIFNIAMAMV